MKGDSLFEYALYYEGGRGNYTTYNEQAETSHYGSGRLPPGPGEPGFAPPLAHP